MTTPLILLSEVKARIDTQTTGNDAMLTRLIRQESSLLQKLCGRRFDERIETRYYDAIPVRNDGPIMGQELCLDADLKSVTLVTNGDGSFPTVTAMPRNSAVKGTLLIAPTSAWTSGTQSPYGAISVTGVWGYGGEWLPTGGTLSSDVNDIISTLPVSDGNLFEVGIVLKIDSEYCYVSAINADNLTVIRGYNGSTAEAHSSGASASRWAADDVVQGLVHRLVAWRAEQDKSPLYGQTAVGDIDIPVATDSVPRDVTATIAGAKLKYIPVGGAI